MGGSGASVSLGMTKGDQKHVIQILLRNGALNQIQCDSLCRSIDKGDSVIASIFLRYEDKKDAQQLVSSLRSHYHTMSYNASYDDEEEEDDDAADDDDDDDDDNDDDDDDDDDEEEEEDDDDDDEEGADKQKSSLDEEDAATIMSKFLEVVRGMDMSNLETAALRFKHLSV